MDASKKVVVYSCITGKLDNIKKIAFRNDGFDYVMFADLPSHSDWDVKPVNHLQNDRITARWYKHNPRILFPEYDYTIWMDGTHWPYSDLTSLIDLLAENDFAVSRHFCRNSTKEEAEICSELNLDEPEKIKKQISFYQKDGFQDDLGLFETCYLVRKNTPSMHKLEKLWWEQIETFSVRDQISLPYCLWKLNYNFSIIPGVCRKGSNPFFKMLSHRNRISLF